MFDIVAYQNGKNLVTDKQIELFHLEEQLKETEIYKKIELCKKELTELEKREQESENEIINAMLNNNLQEIKGNGYHIKIRDTSRPSVQIDDISKVPAEFIRIKKEVDKRAILNLFKNTGVLTSGTDIIQESKWKLTVKKED